MRRPQLSECLALGLLAAVLAAWMALSPPGVLNSHDYVHIHEPNLGYLQAALGEGRIPFWNPHVGLGHPFAANPVAGVFYPPRWFLAFLPVGLWVVLSLAAHFALGAVAFRFLAHDLEVGRLGAWLGALAFLASPPVGGRLLLGHLPMVESACWAPLVLHLALRLQDRPSARSLGLLALAWGLQILCGHSQIGWITAIGAGLLVLGRAPQGGRQAVLSGWRRDLPLLALAFGLSLALAGVLLIPLQEYVAHSLRSAPSYVPAALGPFRPGEIGAGLHTPWLWLSFQRRGLDQCLFLAGPVLLLSAPGLARKDGRNAWGLLALLLGAFVLAISPGTPLRSPLTTLLPGYGVLRGHARFSLLIVLALSLGAGRFLSRPPRLRVTATVLTVWSALLVVSALAGPSAGQDALSGWLRTGALIGVVGAAGLALSLPRWAKARWLLWLVCVVAALDVGYVLTRSQDDVAPALHFPLERPLRAQLERQRTLDPTGPPPRVLVAHALARPCAGMTIGYSSPGFLIQLPLHRTYYYLHARLGIAQKPTRSSFPSPAIYMQETPFPYDTLALELGYSMPQGALVRTEHPDPRVLLAERVQVAGSWEEIVSARRTSPPAGTVFVEEPLPAGVSLAEGTVRIVDFRPDAIEVQLEAEGPALLVLSEPYYPGWEARLPDGRSFPALPVDVWRRGFLLPADASGVVVEYVPRVFAWGALCTALAALVLGVLVLRRPAAAEGAIDPS